MNGDRYVNVACPKCRGGCQLCGGTGKVLAGVAESYQREEFRATVKVERPRIAKDALRTSGVPAVLVKANAIKQATWGLIGLGVALGTLLAAVLLKGCP